jgi:hypothetical protein
MKQWIQLNFLEQLWYSENENTRPDDKDYCHRIAQLLDSAEDQSPSHHLTQSVDDVPFQHSSQLSFDFADYPYPD